MTAEETTAWLQRYLAAGEIRELVPGYFAKDVLPPLLCRDGFTISVQASETHYCQPREHVGPWYAVECGFPSEPFPDSWAEWYEAPTSVAGYVPMEEVVALLLAHGGVVGVHLHGHGHGHVRCGAETLLRVKYLSNDLAETGDA